MNDGRDEQYESIPWDALVTHDATRRKRWIYLMAAGVVVASVSAAISRNLGGASSAAADVPVATTMSVSHSSTTTRPALLAEVDLRPGSLEAQTAEAVAVWFVAEYFTLDGSDLKRRSVAAFLPGDIELPEPAADARSFVESVIPLSSEPVGDGVVRVVCIVRSLSAVGGEVYRREPARAVEVLVDEKSGTVLDLPRPSPIPQQSPRAAFEVKESEAPTAVMDAAIDEAQLWGSPLPLSVGEVGDRWRVVFGVEDPTGLVWPVALWFDEAGEPVLPPS